MLQRNKLMAVLLTAALVFSGNWAAADVRAADVDEVQAEEAAVVQSEAADGELIDTIYAICGPEWKTIAVTDTGISVEVLGAYNRSYEIDSCALKYENEDNGKKLELKGDFELEWEDDYSNSAVALCTFNKTSAESWEQYNGGWCLEQVLIRKTDGSTVTYSSSADFEYWDVLVDDAYFILDYSEDGDEEYDGDEDYDSIAVRGVTADKSKLYPVGGRVPITVPLLKISNWARRRLHSSWRMAVMAIT